MSLKEIKEMIETKVKEVIVGAGNFDFIKAFDLMKQDILALQDKVTQILSKEQQKEASSTLASIPTIPFETSNSKLLTALDEKIELLTKTVNPKETEIIILPGCNHGNGMYKQTKMYQDFIKQFIQKYI